MTEPISADLTATLPLLNTVAAEEGSDAERNRRSLLNVAAELTSRWMTQARWSSMRDTSP